MDMVGDPGAHRSLQLHVMPDVSFPAGPKDAYELRFGIEHSLRFMKREVSLTGAQCNGAQAVDRIALWVELLARVPWWLFALRPFAQTPGVAWPKSWRSRRLTPGAVRRVAVGLFVKLGIHPPQPQERKGKSPGRAARGWHPAAKRYRIFRKPYIASAG